MKKNLRRIHIEKSIFLLEEPQLNLSLGSWKTSFTINFLTFHSSFHLSETFFPKHLCVLFSFLYYFMWNNASLFCRYLMAFISISSEFCVDLLKKVKLQYNFKHYIIYLCSPIDSGEYRI